MAKTALIVGLGYAGSVTARELADAGYSVVVYEKRGSIGGNMFEYVRSNGVRVHMYGPHIFHTDSQKVFDYLSRFSSFYPYTHRVLGRINGQLVPIPFNFTSIDLLFTKKHAELLKSKLSGYFGGGTRVSVSDLTSHSDADISALGSFVFENVFVHYTAKQWGVPVSQVDTSVINRVPVVIGTDDRYFSDSIQKMPLEGFTALFKNLLDHPNIQYYLNCDAKDHLHIDLDSHVISVDGEPFSGPVIYSGPADELFGYSCGALPYRSLDMKFEDCPVDYYQTAAVINYPNEEDYTRITEFKHMTLQVLSGKTTILKEYPLPFIPGGVLPPYYPVAGKENREKYDEYLKLSQQFPNLYLCGRLAEYRYYNMDAVVDRALTVSGQVLADYPAK